MVLRVKIPDYQFDAGGKFYNLDPLTMQVGAPIKIGGGGILFVKKVSIEIEEFQFKPQWGQDLTNALKQILDGFVAYIPETFVAATTTGAAIQYDLTTGAGSLVGLVQPDVSRNVVLTVTDANVSISAMQITVTGILDTGKKGIEVFTDVVSQVGTRCFNSITSIEVDSIIGADAGDVLNVGYGEIIGSLTPAEMSALYKTWYKEL